MQRVDIYIGTENVNQKASTRWTGYVLECMVRGETVTKETFKLRTGTYNAIVLQMIAEAFGRMKEHCEIHIHSTNSYAMHMFPHLSEWEQEGYLCKGGELRKNHDEWHKIWELQQGHLVVPELGEHPYSGWLEAQMEQMRKQVSDNKEQLPDNKKQAFDNRKSEKEEQE